ncbi:probable hexosyltransferase MUCI70 [Mangifera indica]|uniref:probable hexosyltransferase MUCI70 n=1 Tax=Mangifera indica TaxID=29780 RepID=UPI001CF993BE|nr:probable hexosyltransferase MUCI70 [Mangifera indica]XP_044472915.1 probable hexosyltransferase MUCI70 [Mangifera indica]
MTGGSLGIRTASNGSLQSLSNGVGSVSSHQTKSISAISGRKPPSKMLLSGSREREKDRFLAFVCCKYIGRRKVTMLLLVVLALLVFTLGPFIVNKESSSLNVDKRTGRLVPYGNSGAGNPVVDMAFLENNSEGKNTYTRIDMRGSDESRAQHPPPPPSSIKAVIPLSHHPCKNFAFPPPPPPGFQRPGPRPCPVCYLPVEQAIASMPSSQSASPLLQKLTYVQDENPVKTEPHGGSDFGGYPSLKQRFDSFDIKESMTVHCGFVKGSKPGVRTGFDFDEADLAELEQFHEVIVASAIFGNYDLLQQPQNLSEAARKNIPFYMFIDEETEAYMKNSSILDSSKIVGLWRIIVVTNIPYSDARRNGKVSKLLLHRIFPNVRYSIWIDAKLQLIKDPYQILERFLWRQNATFAISRHYRRFDVFVEAEANKAAGKYDNASIDYQMEFYRNEGLTPYSEAKLPITSDVPEGCTIVREHIPITNLFTCLWFNEVDRFTSRDQLSFSIVRDKIMARVDWSVNMFLDCERRNFVKQAYHRDVLEKMAPPTVITQLPSNLPVATNVIGGNPVRRKRAKKEKKSGSKRNRKVFAGNKAINISF